MELKKPIHKEFHHYENFYCDISEIWNLKNASLNTGLKISTLRRLCKQKKISWFTALIDKQYFFYPENLKEEIKVLPKRTRALKIETGFESTFTRFDFAILFNLLIEAKILPDNIGSKKLFCDYLVKNGIFNSTETTIKIFSDYENTIQSKEKILKKFTDKLTNLTTLLNSWKP